MAKTHLKEILQKGLKQVLEEAKVPQHVHLRIIKKLKEELDKHQEDRADFKEIVQQHKEDTAKHEENDQSHEQQVSAFIDELNRIQSIKEGPPGKDGEDAIIPSPEELLALLRPHISAPIKGDPGLPGAPGRNGLDADEEKILMTLIKKIQKGGVIHISHVAGAGAFIKDGIKYRTEELMHGGGVKQYDLSSQISAGNMTFTLPFASSNWKVYLDGQRSRSPADYSIAGVTLTTIFAPITSLICDL